VALGVGGPVYAWAPLAWGEPLRPWWGNCSYNCWTHYNRPYAVRTDERNYRAPPAQYVNAGRPGGVTAVGSAAFTGQKPVRANLVNVPPSQAASLPVAMSAPSARPTGMQKPLITPGTSNTPKPASTYYAPSRRDAIGRPAFPGTTTTTSIPGATKPGSGATSSTPMPRSAAPARDYPVTPPASYTQPSSKPSPATSAPSTTTSVPMGVPPPTRYVAPVQRETVQPYTPPPQRAAPAQPMYTAPVQRETVQTYVPPQRAAPQPQPAQSAPSAGLPMPPPRIAPQPAPQVQHAPQPAPAVVVPQAPPPQPAGRARIENNNDGGGRGAPGGGNEGGGGGDRGPGPKPGQRQAWKS